MEISDAQVGQRQFPCKQCGANLVFEPGTTALTCQYCGTRNDIAPLAEDIEELDFDAHAAQLAAGSGETQETLTVRCNGCGAETDFTHDVAASRCPFCGAAIVATASSKKQIKPRSLLPFHVNRQQAGELFMRWVKGLWFAPNDLTRVAQRSGIDGAYIPAWTYDSQTTSDYAGERGDDYWDTETYTALENGKSVRRTRQVRKTRWRHASGRVFVPFDDVLVPASRSLPPKQLHALEPWDLRSLVPYRDEYLSGFAAESYQVDLAQGFEAAKGIMAGTIGQAIRHDIGGDHQRIHSVRTRYRDVTFKHILLPVWISAYRYHERVFRFLVNARTGEVQGERPWSAVKITLLVLFILAVLAAVLLLTRR
jgi:ribosomal protein S27E